MSQLVACLAVGAGRSLSKIGTGAYMTQSAVRFCLRVQAGILGALGLYILLALAGPPDEDKRLRLVAFSTALLLPIVLYLFTLPRYLRNKTEGGESAPAAGARVNAIPLVLSAVLYLPLMILMSSDLQGWKRVLEAVPLFLVLWLFCACAYQWLGGQRAEAPAENGGLARVLSRALELSSRLLLSPLLLLLGVVLLARSLWAEDIAFRLLKGGETWITAEYGLGSHIDAARLFLDYFGPLVYAGSLVVGACTVVLLLACRFSSVKLRASRAATVVALAAAFLAIASVTDYYFSWLSFLLDGKLPAADWILFALFFLHWAVPLLVAFRFLRATKRKEQTVWLALRTLVVFYTPLLLFDLAMTPFFVSDFGSQFALDTFLGLQFLSWGYVQAAATR